MQFKLDENLSPSAAALFRECGHDVRTVYDQGLQSCDDPTILSACQIEGRTLVSLDLDFSNILVFPPEQYAGLIVLRLQTPGPRAVLRLLRRMMPHLDTVPVRGRLWIVNQQRIRVRLVGDIDLGPEVEEFPVE